MRTMLIALIVLGASFASVHDAAAKNWKKQRQYVIQQRMEDRDGSRYRVYDPVVRGYVWIQGPGVVIAAGTPVYRREDAEDCGYTPSCAPRRVSCDEDRYYRNPGRHLGWYKHGHHHDRDRDYDEDQYRER